MSTLLTIAVALLVLVILFFGWGFARLRKGYAQAETASRQLTPDELPPLVTEALEGLRHGWQIEIDLTDAESTAKAIDSVFADPHKLKNTFAKDHAYWHFALPIGALLGEFMRLHSRGVWQKDEEGLLIITKVGEAELIARPFEKVLKQIHSGAPGDIYAYLMAGKQFASGEVPLPIED